MNKNDLKGKVVSGLVWKFGERIIAQTISLVISIILARILSPKEYGIISLVLIFITFANVFINDGLGAPLIQKKDSDNEDFSTMLYCSLILSIILYSIIFFIAPLVSSWYHQPQLTSVLRVMALQIPLSSFKTIQHAYVSKNMLFKKFFWSTLGGTIISGIVGIIMAFKGFGVWSLVIQYLTNSLIDMIVLFFTVDWRPQVTFNIKSAISMCSYGVKLLGASLINTLYIECRSLIIGRLYSEADLAYNSKGNQFPALIINNINTSMSSVLFPALSTINDDPNRIKQMTRRSLKLSSYVIFPLMIGMISISTPFITLLLTEKWLPCVPFLQLSCIYWLFQPCLTANNEAIKAIGRSDICLKYEFIKKIFGFSLVFLTMKISVYALALSNVFFALFSMIMNMIPTRKIIHYGYFEQFKDLFPNFILSIIMGIFVYLVALLKISTLLTLLLQVTVGVFIYLFLSSVFKIDSYQYIKNSIKKFFHSRSK